MWTIVAKKILSDLKVRIEGPVMLYCDNKATINIAHNPVQYDRTKHVEIDWHFIKEKLDLGQICIPYISLNSQLADIITKGLPRTIFQRSISKLGMWNIFALTWGGVLELCYN